jgi:SPASM domain peptide maturase of grasp-with-spasm system
MKSNEEYIQLYSNCVTVKGYNRSLIVDTQRESFHFITNDLFDIIDADFPITYSGLVEKYGEENKETISSYLDFLINRELILFTDQPNNFPSMSHDWDVPRVIANGIIDIDQNSGYNILKGIVEMDALGAEAIQIRIFGESNLSSIEDMVIKIGQQTKRLRVLELLLKYNPDDDYTNLNINMMVSSIIVYHSPVNKVERDEKYGTMLIYTTQEIYGSDHCGVILPQYFTPRIDFVLESKQYNSCLNKKISIDAAGFIKNCPSMIENYGHIDSISLNQVLFNEENGFKRKWLIKKEDVEVCKDCEFRLICSDCRAFTNGGDLAKPAKCRYSPYTNRWEEAQVMANDVSLAE